MPQNKFLTLLFKSIAIIMVPLSMGTLAAILYGIPIGINAAATGVEPQNITAYITDRLSADILYITAFSNLLTLMVFLAYIKLRKRPLLETYKIKDFPVRLMPHIIALGVVGIFLSSGISGLLNLSSLDPEAAKNLESLVNTKSATFTLLLVGIWVPLVEEFVFRGMLLTVYKRHMPLTAAIILQALLFGLFHLNPIQALPTAILGLTLGLSVVYTDSLLAGIAIHAINNSLVVLMSQMVDMSSIESAASTAASSPTTPTTYIVMIVISGASVISLLMDMRKKRVVVKADF